MKSVNIFIIFFRNEDQFSHISKIDYQNLKIPSILAILKILKILTIPTSRKSNTFTFTNTSFQHYKNGIP